MNLIVAATHPGNEVGVSPTVPSNECRPDKCETRIHIGIFFDGTGNNQDWVENTPVNWRKGLVNWWHKKPLNTRTQLQQRSDSNVARLFRAYRDDPAEGYFPIYVAGIGTPFKDIGEITPAGFGAAFGEGGEGRINFGMLAIINSMYRSISVEDRPLISAKTIRALCSLGRVGTNPKTGESSLSADTRAALAAVGMADSGGLLTSLFDQGHRVSFFRRQFASLQAKIAATPKPQLVEVFIDVFGFSRGAAQARVFCNWLEPFFTGGNLAGVKTHIRFLGLFDSVAAVGLGTSASEITNGHQGWGDPVYLRIPKRVAHCEHYVAMHENRGAFPLEDAALGGVMPANVRQYRFPGMHSDVGGGYSPSDQGRGPGQTDSEKLSQIPLNFMFDAARVAKVPLDKNLAVKISAWDCFEISPTLKKAYESFIEINGRGQRALRDCLIDYLAWRYSVRGTYGLLASTHRASADDKADLIGANETLIRHARDYTELAEAKRRLDLAVAQRAGPDTLEELRRNYRFRQSNIDSLSKYATEVYERVRDFRPINSAEADLFANYCHDSYAGFKPFDAPIVAGLDAPGDWETEGYLRYRTRYEGFNVRLTQLEENRPSRHRAYA